MTEAERAEAFAESVACYGYPHSGAIEAYGAEIVEGLSPETWKVGAHLVVLRRDGIRLVRPLTHLRGAGLVR